MTGCSCKEGTVFQVYSPDELKQTELQAKIEEDCGRGGRALEERP